MTCYLLATGLFAILIVSMIFNIVFTLLHKINFFWSAKNPEGTPSTRGQFSFNYRIFFFRMACLYIFENGASKIL